MPTLSNRCPDCGRPATCSRCGRCVLCCPCPSPEEIEAANRANRQRAATALLRTIRDNCGEEILENRGQTIVLDRRTNHVGQYLALDAGGNLWWNWYDATGRGMVEYNYRAAMYRGNPAIIIERIRELEC